MDVLEQDAKDSKVDPAASALDVVTDTDYLSPVLQAAFKLAANNCGRFGAFLANEGQAVLELNFQTLAPNDLPAFPQELNWEELPE